MLRYSIAPILLLTLGACSSPAPANSSTDAGSAMDTSDPPDTAVQGVPGCNGGQTTVGNYPDASYGYTKGKIAPDVCLTGYLNYDQQTLVPMALHDFYDPYGTSGNSVLFLSAGMLWCGPCNQEAPTIASVGNSVKGQGAVVWQIVLDGPTYGVGAVEADLKSWDTMYKLPIWEAMDPTRASALYFPTPHPPGLFIETKTMRILKELHGVYDVATLKSMLLKCVATPDSC